MVPMKRLLWLGFLLSVSAFVRADLSVKVEPAHPKMGESIMLTITDVGGSNQAVTPNITPLENDFTITGTQRSMNYSIYNGQTHAVVQWLIQMEPKKAGTLTIPAITVGTQKTLSQTIEVKEENFSQTSVMDESVYLKTEVDEKNPYVNQEVTYTVKVYYSVRLMDPQYIPPEVDDALLRPIGETQQFQEIINNKRYIVEQQKYAIFPQKSGALTIKSPRFKALLFDAVPRQIQAKDAPITLDIKPAPAKSATHPNWLPAKNIELSEKYSELGTNLSQGTTIVRTITLDARGVPAELLPNISLASGDKFSVYPEQSKPESVVDVDDLVGKTEIKATYLFNKAGVVEIPELQIPWFNTISGKNEVATLPARTFEIKETVSSQKNTDAPIKPETDAVQKDTSSNANTSNRLWYLVIVFALGWIVTAGLWLRQSRKRPKDKKLYKTYVNTLECACLQNDAPSARLALLNWASLQWPDANIRNLMDIAQLDDTLKKDVTTLSETLYSKKGKNSWKGDALWKVVSAIINRKRKKAKSKYVLPSINPK